MFFQCFTRSEGKMVVPFLFKVLHIGVRLHLFFLDLLIIVSDERILVQLIGILPNTRLFIHLLGNPVQIGIILLDGHLSHLVLSV